MRVRRFLAAVPVAVCIAILFLPAGGLAAAQPLLPTENVLYAFAPGKVAIIDPANARVVKDLEDGLGGVEWADPVVTRDNRLLFANDRANSQVVVIDTETQEIINRLDVGQRPVHIYNPLGGTEIWTHSDGEGAFYVIDTATLAVNGPVVAAAQGTGHGKLLDHPDLGNKAYATNTNDAAIYVIDLAAREVTATIPTCQGTHGKAYSLRSKHAYIECGAAAQTAIIDTRTDTVLRTMKGSGQLFVSPDERFVLQPVKADGVVRVFDASKQSEVVAEIPVTGGPDHIYFHEHGGHTFAFTANTLSPDTAVIDLHTMAVTKRIFAGNIERPEGAQFLHRSGDVGGKYFFTPASGDGLVAIIDAENLTLHDTVPLEGVDQVAYVGGRR